MRKRIVGAIICMVLIMSTFALAATTVNLGTENYRSKKYLVTKEQGDSYFMAEGLLVNTDGCLTTGKNRGSSVCWIN
ncbi:MAG: hypothetical protein IJZ25_00490, partial [Lachnospiraceae bacterium]|nr:hypothetical protein [Lachnospiraceae bacterium]